MAICSAIAVIYVKMCSTYGIHLCKVQYVRHTGIVVVPAHPTLQ